MLVIEASGGIGGAVADAAAGAQVVRPPRSERDITDDASVEAYFALTAPIAHVIVAAVQTKSGSVTDS